MFSKILIVFLMLSFVLAKNRKSTLNFQEDIFIPKEIVSDPIDELEDDLDFEDETEIDFFQSLNLDIKNYTNLDSFFHFILANKVIKPTLPEDNIIEVANSSEFPYEFISNLNFTFSYIKSNNTWRNNGNVCNSKIIYLNTIEKYQEYSFDFKCEERADSEICEVYLVTGSKKFTVQITTLCCPGYELKNNSCIKINYSDHLLDEVFESLEVINRTVTGYLELSEIDLYSDIGQDFFVVINKIKDVLEENSKVKLTIFLWDNRFFLDKINQLFNSDHYELDEILNQINLILINHVIDLHHPTQSLMSNKNLPNVNGNLRLFRQNINNVSKFFINCFEVISANNYFKKLDEPYEYQLIIHKLEKGSLLIPQKDTIFDKLEHNILLTTSTFKIFKEMFKKNSDLLFSELTSLEPFKTLLIPSDQAFKKLTHDEIESLIIDEKCSLKLFKRNLLEENVCPNQLYKYNLDFQTSREIVVENLITNQIGTYKPWFKTISINNSKFLLYNNQQIRLSKYSLNLNGIIYAINNLNTEETGLLTQMVKHVFSKISPTFISYLNPNWMEILRKNSNNCSLMVSGLKFFLNNSNETNSIMVQDYIFKPKFNLYELNNGQVITSLNRKQYLINSIETKKKSFNLFRYLPKKYFYSKYINCQEIEESQISACNSELFFFNSRLNLIPDLNSKSLLYHLNSDNDFVYFNQMLNQCGKKCEQFLLDLEMKSKKNSTGFTLFIPINNFTSENLIFEMKKRFFYDTLCEAMLLNESFNVKNLFKRVFKSNYLIKWIQKSQSYLSKTGILIHKTFWL